MILQNIYLKNFRNYDDLNLEFNPHINIVLGNNAQGKTNLVEAIYVLALTKSHRIFIDNNLIKKNKKQSKIKGKIINNNIKSELEINISEDGKTFKINKNDIKKMHDYISNLNIIMFSPDDLEILKDSPDVRRKFLNTELGQIYNRYIIVLNNYNKLLKSRNEYLKKLNSNVSRDFNYLSVLTTHLIDTGVILYKMRKKFIERINENIAAIFENITTLPNLYLTYKTSFDITNLNEKEIKTMWYNILRKQQEREILLGNTLVGPHRDDFLFMLGEDELKTFGSQGQQRMAVLALKLSEITIFQKYLDRNPILILDDIFSELDAKKRKNILKYVNTNMQTFITTTDIKFISKKLLHNAKIFYIDNGKVIKQEEVN